MLKDFVKAAKPDDETLRLALKKEQETLDKVVFVLHNGVKVE